MQAAEPGGGGPRGTNTGSRTASSMEVTSAMERSSPEPQLNDGHLPGPWSCPREDRATILMVPQPPRAWGTQLQGPSVLECKVRALKEKMTTGKPGMSPGLTSHERPSSKKLRCRRVKVGGTGTLLEGSSQPDAAVVLHAQNLTNGQLGSSGNEEEPARNGGRSPPRPPAPGLHHWNGRSLWPPEAVWMLPDHKRGLPPGPDSLPESPVHRSTPGQPEGPGRCNKSTHMPIPREGRPYPLQDGPVTGRDLDSLSLTSEEDFVPRPALLVGLWRAGDLGAPGTGGNALSLSDRVERNRRQLQEMLSVGGRVPPKVGIPAWPPSWDGAAAERPAGDADWDSGISLQDSDQNRTFGPKSERVLSPRHEKATHLLQHARMKARTRPLRASHEIMPTIAQGSRDGGRSPALDPRMTFAFRDNLQNGNTSDSSSGESSSGQWPKPGTSPSHVRFEDESACDAESRYLERLQQRQRQVLSSALQRVDPGPLRCKPNLAHYISGGCRCRDAGKGPLCRLVGSQDQRGLLAPPPAPGSEGKCCACSSRMEDPHLGQGQAPPGPRVLQEREAACGVEEVQVEPLSSWGPSTPVRLLPAEQGLHTERSQETHIGHPLHPEEVDSALDSTDTSDSCRTDSEEVGTPQPGKASRPRLRGSRPRGGPRKFRKAETELPGIPQALCYLSAVDHLEVGDKGQEGRGQMPEGTLFPRGDAFSRPPALESKRASLGSQWQPGPGLGSHRAQPVDFRAPCWAAFATTSCMKLGSSGPGRQAQGRESHLSLETVCTSSQQTQAEVCQAQQPTASLTPDDWVPASPSLRKTTSPVSHGKAALAGPCRLGDQGELVDTPVPPSRSVVLRTCELDSLQAQPSSPLVRHPLLALSTTNCNNSGPSALQEPWGGATPGGRVEKGPCSQEPELPLENRRDGGLRSFLGSAAVGTTNPMSITLSLTSEEPESGQEPEGGLQRTELSSGGHVSSRSCKHAIAPMVSSPSSGRFLGCFLLSCSWLPAPACSQSSLLPLQFLAYIASPGVSAGAGAPSAVPSSRNKKSSSLTSTLGLKKLFLALGQGTRPRLGKTYSYSVEHLQPPAPGLASHTSTPKVKRAPSLQFLHLGSPSSQHRKAASFQNLHSLLSGKVDRSSRYLVGEPGEHSAAGRPSRAPPRRALSVEDVSAPSLARTVGRVVEVFPDGTSQLLLQRSPNGTFGFCVASGAGRRDSGHPSTSGGSLLLGLGGAVS
ncbi:uncharacterized protein KIAA1614 homolog isoform X4 [Manis javanica]|uniref:uncharacterized protein KIAA1614 homolog isoform X4 n=1 Tax=Manis javanica TaxID=9974 RepID=UPI003C6D3277